MDKGKAGKMMLKYTLGDTKMAIGLKGSCFNYKEITVTHSSMSSMMKMKMR
jgi:hypothetical protein